MKPQHDYPYRICEVENAWIPLSDGVRLAARYWLPEDASQHTVPAILEYIPYRKRDHTTVRDETLHTYFAGHGYCAIRVDMRGSGDSDGVLLDEYLIQEQEDALEVIAWIAAQPWCNGRVGMMGKSWGGFNALQVAARQPPALHCIMTLHSTTDRFADDIHYMGGCLLSMNPQWGFTMLCRNAQPPDPRYVGDRWRRLWRQRLEANRPWITEWLRHQRRDAYWAHGSVCEDYTAIRCPVLTIGGWADGYSNTVARLIEGLSVPVKGLVGPWGHQYPHCSSPGPRIGFLQEALRWWDHWLKEIDTGVLDDPIYRVWMQEAAPPGTDPAERPGRWVAETSWPSPRLRWTTLALRPDGLAEMPGREAAMPLECPPTVGLASLQWSNKGTGDDLVEEPEDQRIDDCRSLCFDTAPLTESLEILGAPVATLDVAVDQPLAFVCLRLCEVLPDGRSSRVTYGLHNLALDAAWGNSASAHPGQRRRIEVRLNDVAHRFATGSRIRLAVSTSFWPVVWPSPVPVHLTLYTAQSTLSLPRRPPRSEDAVLRALATPLVPPPRPSSVLRSPSPHLVTVLRDVRTRTLTVTDTYDAGVQRIDRDGWTYGSRSTVTRSIVADDPLSARLRCNGEMVFSREGELDTRIEVDSSLTADRDDFIIEAQVKAYDDGQLFFQRRWSERVARDTV